MVSRSTDRFSCFNSSRTKENDEKSRRATKDDASTSDNKTQAVNFPDVKTRKNILPPLVASSLSDRTSDETDPSANNNAASTGGGEGRALPKRRTSTDENRPPRDKVRRRGSQSRRQSATDDDGSAHAADKGGRLPPIREPSRERDEDYDAI